VHSIELKIAAILFTPFILLELYFCYKRIRQKLKGQDALNKDRN